MWQWHGSITVHPQEGARYVVLVVILSVWFYEQEVNINKINKAASGAFLSLCERKALFLSNVLQKFAILYYILAHKVQLTTGAVKNVSLWVRPVQLLASTSAACSSNVLTSVSADSTSLYRLRVLGPYCYFVNPALWIKLDWNSCFKHIFV